MNNLNIFLIFLLTFNIAAKNLDELESRDFSNLSFNRLQSTIHSYSDFLSKHSAENYKMPDYQDFEVVSDFSVENFLRSQLSAYASDGGLCFIGGWPSKIKDEKCQVPWVLQGDREISKYGDVYAKDKSCGQKDRFRCSLIPFGGECVDTQGSFDGITQKCAQASKGNISNLANQIKNDPAKAKALAKLNQAIFGQAGVCSAHVMKQGRNLDCETLSARLKSLTDPNSTGQLDQNGKPQKISKPITTKSLAVLNACEQHLIDNSSDDVNNRGLLQSLQGGLVSCLQSQVTFEEESLKDMELIAKRFEKRKMLRKINLKSFEYQLEALLNSEYAFMQDLGDQKTPIFDSDKLKEFVSNRFQTLKTDLEYQKVFNKIHSKFLENSKNKKMQKIDFKTASKNLSAMAIDTQFGVNKFCEQIGKDFKTKFQNKNFVRGFEWARPYSDEEKQFIEEAKIKMNQRLDYAVAKSQVGFLLGTKNFKDKIFDPSVDHTKECIQNSPSKVLSANLNEAEYKTSLKEAQKVIMASFDDLNKKEAPLQDAKAGGRKAMNSEASADDLIKDYLKENRMVVVDTLMNEDSTNQLNMSKYLCQKVTEVYDRDETMQIVSWVGAGASLVGGVACVFPLTAPIGCPVMWGGTAMAGVSGGAKVYEANVLSGAADQNQLVLNDSASDFNKRSNTANDQLKDGAIELGGAGLGAGAGVLVKGVKAAVKGARSIAGAKSAVTVYDDGLSLVDDASDAIYFKDPETGNISKRLVSQKAKANSLLSDTERLAGLKKDFPQLSQKQLEAVLKAHSGLDDSGAKIFVVSKNGQKIAIDCEIGACSKAQLAAKMQFLKEQGIKAKDYKELIRLGYAGKPNANLAAVADDGFWSARIPNQTLTSKLALASDHPNASVVSALESIPSSGGGKFVKLNVERLMPDGSVQTKSVQGYFRGSSEGKLLQFESGSEGMFAIDVNDANLVIRNIEVPQSRVVNGVMQADSYKAVYETKAMSAFSRSEGQNVAVRILDEDGDIIDIAGEVVNQKGKLKLKSPNKYSPGQFIYTELDELKGVQEISSKYKKVSWSGASAHPRDFKESFKVGAKIKADYISKPTYGDAVAAKIEGEYLGVVTHDKIEAIAVKISSGEVKYIPLNSQTVVNGLEEGSTLFNNGMLGF